MKKVLISLLLVLLTLSLFVSCNPAPKTKEVELILDGGETTYTIVIPAKAKWSDLDWDDNDKFEITDGEIPEGSYLEVVYDDMLMVIIHHTEADEYYALVTDEEGTSANAIGVDSTIGDSYYLCELSV